MADGVTHNNKPRPRYLNLFQIRLPITAVVSISHRLSGLLLFLAAPLAPYLLQRSLSGPDGYAAVRDGLASLPWPVSLALIWAGAHHILAGLRLLALDAGLGEDRPAAQRGAWVVLVAAILVTLAAGVALW